MNKGRYGSGELKAFSSDLHRIFNPDATLLIDFERDIEKKLSKKKQEDFDLNLDWFPRNKYSDDLIHELGNWNWSFQIPLTNRYDLIFGNFPLNSKYSDSQTIEKALEYLTENGKAIFISSEGHASQIQENLPKKSYFVEAILKAPKPFLKQITGIPLCVLIIGQKDVKKIFYAELPSYEDKGKELSDTVLDVKIKNTEIINNFMNQVNSENFQTGMLLSKDYQFTSFLSIESSIKIDKLDSIYKEYKKFTLEDLAKEINTGKYNEENFEEADNSIYIPSLGKGPVHSNIYKLTMKQQNYYQVILANKAFNEYVCCFFESKIGRLSLNVARKGVIPHISKSKLMKIPIGLPNLKTQKKIVEINRTLISLQYNLDSLKEELAVNPMNVTSMGEIEDIASTVSGFTTSSNLRNQILSGESKTVEFKETFSLDVKTQQKEKYIEHSSLKTIDGFLNAKGGMLFIGVNDAQQVTGIDDELNKFYKGNEDKYLLHFKNKLDSHIDIKFSDSIDYKIVELDGKKILLVECLQSDKPCWIKKDFYVRTGPSTVKLEGPELYEYIENHFHANKD
jgi:hypothetical protein